jgi:hypothetical protein
MRRFVPLPDPCSAANGTGRVMSAGRLGKTERLRQRMPMRAYFAPLDATMSLYGEVTATYLVSGSTILPSEHGGIINDYQLTAL